MFHTFEITRPKNLENVPLKRRISTNKACEPCRQRKTRCSGQNPCDPCKWHRNPDACTYNESKPRPRTSRSFVEETSQNLHECQAILQKLFPDYQRDQLKDMSRETLVELISKPCPFHSPSPGVLDGEACRTPVHPDAGSLEQLQPMPGQGKDAFEKQPRALRGIADDVNMLSLSVKTTPSYLGISSVMAILRVITWLDPTCLPKSPERSAIPSRESSPSPENNPAASDTVRGDSTASSAWEEIPLINAYFKYVHPFIPLIDEQTFRDTYMAEQRTDSRWLLLLNSVLAMGSVADASSDDITHKKYYNRAKRYLHINTLDSAHIETIQALAILSGFYLHYIQIPNQANALMGAAWRLAAMLGLHRDYSEGVGPTHRQLATSTTEMRRRIWWCIFMLDSWVGSTLGRPSMGRWNHAVSIKTPQDPIGQSAILLTLVQENVRFCVISTRMEDALAISPLLDEHTRQSLDSAYVDWLNHSSVQNSQLSKTDPAGVVVLKNVMRWRYFSNRITLHRPILLWYAMQRMSWEQLSLEKQSAVELCRELCSDLISDISTTWRGHKACQMSGWNATWLLYQASMVPLLSLYLAPRDIKVAESSSRQVELAMQTLRDLDGWSPTAQRSLQVISTLYNARKRQYPATCQPEVAPPSDFEPGVDSAHDSALDGPSSVENYPPNDADISWADSSIHRQASNANSNEAVRDSMFNSLNWSSSWDTSISGLKSMNGWDYNSVLNWADISQSEEYLSVELTDDTSDMDVSWKCMPPPDQI